VSFVTAAARIPAALASASMGRYPTHEHRIARRDRIDPLVTGSGWPAQSVWPITTGDPFAGLQGLAYSFRRRMKLLAGRGIAQTHRCIAGTRRR